MCRVVLLLLGVTLGGLVVACESDRPASRSQQDTSDWTLLVREAHALADAAKSDVERRAAAVALRQALSTAPPANTAKVRFVVQDLYFRLAQGFVDANQFSDAEQTIDQGLAIAAEPTVARANLLALQGKVYEAQAKPEQAAKALHDALLINEALLDRALNGEMEPEGQ